MAELAVCEHGSLLRQCEVCEIAGELRRLSAELADAREQVIELRTTLRTYREREQTMGWNQK